MLNSHFWFVLILICVPHSLLSLEDGYEVTVKPIGNLRQDGERNQITKRISQRPDNMCSVVEFDQWGNMTIFRDAVKETNRDVTFGNLERRVKQAVERYGLFPKNSYLFDLSVHDLPSCARARRFAGRSCGIMSETCCQHGLHLIGVATNICCKCSTPLPIHGNQLSDSLQNILKFDDPVPWEKKRNKAVWHGSRNLGNEQWLKFYTRHFHNDTERKWYGKLSPPRVKLVSLSKMYPSLLEASFSYKRFEFLLNYRYIVTVSGNSYSGLLKHALNSKSCVLRQDPITTEWYESWLIPWVHYVPVRYDLSDVMERINWARSHDDECRKIGERGSQFAKYFFSDEEVDKFVYRQISRLGV